MNRELLVNIAAEYRTNREYEGGVVLVFENKVYGWKNQLRDAVAEKPGAFAIDVDGHIFEAQGGDDYNGAKAWVLI